MNRYTICSTFCILLFLFIGITGKYTRKEAQPLRKRMHELVEMSSKRVIIRLTGEKFYRYISTTPRNYSFIVMMTALSQHRKCSLCGYAYDEFNIVANSWKYLRFDSNRLFFGMVDFDEGSDVFHSLGLDSAPVFMHFPEKGKPKTGDQMDIQRIGFQAETIAKWIAERTDIHIRVIRPPNHSAAIALAVLFTLIGTLLYKCRNNLDFLYNKNAYGFIASSFVIIFASGQVWNHIRGPPFMHFSKEGGVGYIYGNSHGQYIVETYIIIFLYATITVGMILMLEVRGSKGDYIKRKFLAIVGFCAVVVSFSLILIIFKMKMPSYPFSFLFKFQN